MLETLPGATLAALIDDGLLGVADTAVLGRQLVSVLGYLHRHGWLHLDVKPENVVVQEGRAVLIDLGVAARPGPVERGVGTEGYAAPEQDAGGTVSPGDRRLGAGRDARRVRAPARPPAGTGPRAGARRAPPLLTGCLAADPERRPALGVLADRLDALAETPQPWLRRWWPRPRRR